MHRPIGVFDSGVGGLTVARAIIDQLPAESITYIGDTANGPYGPRAQAEVRHLALDVLDTLVDQGVKMLVIACNTASTIALATVREALDLPIVGTVPAIKPAALQTRTGVIGLLGTEATIRQSYVDRLEAEDEAWVGVLAGAGPAFCAGADLKAISEGRDAGITTRRSGFAGFCRRERTKPVIAAVDGPALAGGCEIVLACDLVVASTSASFGLPEVKRSLVAAAGGGRDRARGVEHERAVTVELVGCLAL